MIELLCALAVACILASLAYPSYLAIVMRSRRLDAQVALLQLQTNEERYRTANAQYGVRSELGAASSSPAGFYAIDVLAASASGYELLATALGMQQGDTVCRNLKLSMIGETIVYASGADSDTSNSAADNKRCWGI